MSRKTISLPPDFAKTMLSTPIADGIRALDLNEGGRPMLGTSSPVSPRATFPDMTLREVKLAPARRVEIRPFVQVDGFALHDLRKQQRVDDFTDNVMKMLDDLRSIVVRGPWPMIERMEFRLAERGLAWRVWLSVPERESGERAELVANDLLDVDYATQIGAAGVVRVVLLKVLEHELEESIYLNGARVLDPHTNGPRR